MNVQLGGLCVRWRPHHRLLVVCAIGLSSLIAAPVYGRAQAGPASGPQSGYASDIDVQPGGERITTTAAVTTKRKSVKRRPVKCKHRRHKVARCKDRQRRRPPQTPVTPPQPQPARPPGNGLVTPPETFVPLETDQFAAPAATACADNDRVVQVPSAAAPTITSAVTMASPGTLIRVQSGSYSEHAGEWFALELGAANVCVVSVGGPVVLQAAPGQTYGMLITGDDVVVSGFELRGFSYNISLGDGVRTQRRVTLEDVAVTSPVGGWTEGIIAYADHRGDPDQPPTVDGLLLSNVRIEGTDMGISCNAGPCQHWWLDRVNVTGRRGSEDSGADTFAIESGRQIAVVDSVFANSAADGIDTKAGDVLVLRSRVRDAGRNGIKLWRGGDVINSVVDGSGADASLVGDGPGRYRYLHVLVTRHDPGGTGYVGSWGYDTGAAVQLEITNSIFVDNATGGLFIAAAGSVRLFNNLLADRGAKLLDYQGFATRIDLAGLDSLQSDGHGSGNLIGTATFVDRLGGNYRPSPDSAARDAGLTAAAPTTDLYGAPRTQGAGPDVGPAEGDA